jgi:kinesin family protein C2/C3
MFLSQVKLFLILLLIISLSEQTLEKQAENLRSIYNRYELDKKKWAEAIISLQEKVKVNDKKRCLKLLYFFSLTSQEHIKNISTKFDFQVMRSEQSRLSLEAHECVDSIPELNKMVFAVQELGMLQLHYSISIFVS